MSVHEDAAVGLCARCRHARQVATPRSLFWLCELSRTDTSYARYPRLPMLKCPGFEPGGPAGPEISKDDGRKK
jgi:hypothetical protein